MEHQVSRLYTKGFRDCGYFKISFQLLNIVHVLFVFLYVVHNIW